MKKVSTIDKLKNEGKAVLEINRFNKCESKIIKDAANEGLNIEVTGSYENNGHTYVVIETVAEIVEEVKETETFTTRKQVIEHIGFAPITEEFLTQLNNETKAKYNKFKTWIADNEYFGVYVKDDEVIINSPTGSSLKYIETAVNSLTGKQLISEQKYIREVPELWEAWKNINQYTGGGE